MQCNCPGAAEHLARGGVPIVTITALRYGGAIRAWSLAVETCGHCHRVLKGIDEGDS